MAMQTFDLHGTYSWQLLLDIDNSTNAGYFYQEHEVVTSIFVSNESLVREVLNFAIAAHSGFDANVKLKLVSLKMGAYVDASAAVMIESITNKETIIDIKTTDKRQTKVGPYSKLKLYQLIFNGPGMSQRMDTVASSQLPMDEVIISCQVQALTFLERINVVYTSDEISKPANSLLEVQGLTGDINHGYGGNYVWLVPVWTTNIKEAATAIEVVIQDTKNSDYIDMAQGAGGSFRYLKMIRDPHAKTGITELKLWRTYDPGSKHGWSNWTQDINLGRGGVALFICWDNGSLSIDTPPNPKLAQISGNVKMLQKTGKPTKKWSLGNLLKDCLGKAK